MELDEDYPAVIDALEERLRLDPSDPEVATRLGFNLWYAVVENLRMGKKLPVEHYARRFMELFRQFSDVLADNADFCWAYGLGIHLFWRDFPGATAELGESLMDRAGALDRFWAKVRAGLVQPVEMERLRGRGIFEGYYLPRS